MTGPSRFAVVKELLQGDIAALVRELVPGAHRSGAVWSAKAPRRQDRKAGSFVVWAAPVAGAWKDYATGEQGDVIDLVAYCLAVPRLDAVAWAENRYGVRRMTREEHERLYGRAIEKRRAEEKADVEREAKRRAWAIEMFKAARPSLKGTPVETYAEARGTPLAAIPSLEHQWFRYAPALEWWRGAERDETGRKVRPGPRFPALVSAMVDRTGTMRAVHCTFLAEDGSDKAPVEKPKLMFPRVAELVIRVSRGDSRMTPETAAAHGLIGPGFVGEGVEDGWTMAFAMPEVRCFAAGSLAGLQHMPDLACVESWLVGRDNDWGKAQAAEQFGAAFRRIQSFGKPAAAISATGGAKDFNDMVR